MLRTTEEIPMAVSPIRSMRMKKANQAPKENSLWIMQGKATFMMSPISLDCHLCQRNIPYSLCGMVTKV